MPPPAARGPDSPTGHGLLKSRGGSGDRLTAACSECLLASAAECERPV